MVAPPRPAELRRLQMAAAAFVVVLLCGIVGYQAIAGFSPIDALYMTVITVTTVGFAEVAPLDESGRLLTIALIAGGVGTVSYSAVTAAEFVVEGHLGHYIERRRMHRRIESLADHVIICGYGRVGRHLANALERDDVGFVVVEIAKPLEDLLESEGRLFVSGDASTESVLLEAGIDQARAVVASVRDDADNVLVTLTAKGLHPNLTVIARAKSDENEKKLMRAGADRVILPEFIGGRRIAALLTRPAVTEFLEGLGVGGVDYTLEELHIGAGHDLAATTLQDAGVRERFGCTVLAVRKANGALDTNPTSASPLDVGDVLVIMGAEDDVRRLREHYRT